MTDIHLDKIPRQQALDVAKTVFGMSDQQAEMFVALARGEAVNDVITTKAIKAKLGKGARFAALKTKLTQKPATTDMDDMAANGKAFGGLGNTTFGAGNRKTGSLNLTRSSNHQGSRKTGSLGNTVFGSGNRRTGATNNLDTGSGSRKTGSLGLTKIQTEGAVAGSVNQPKKNSRGTHFFPVGRKIGLLLGKSKGHTLIQVHKEYNLPKGPSAATFKYSALQARIPSGVGGGRWTSGGMMANMGAAAKIGNGIRTGWVKHSQARSALGAVGLGVANGLLAKDSRSHFRGAIKSAVLGNAPGAATHTALWLANKVVTHQVRNRLRKLDKRGRWIATGTSIGTSLALGVGPRGIGKKSESDDVTFKYSASQARIPAGSPGGGRWTKASSTGSVATSSVVPRRSGSVRGAVGAAGRGVGKLWSAGRPARQVYRAVGLGITHGAVSQQEGDGFFRGAGAALQGDWRRAGAQALKYGAARLGAEKLTGPAINRLDARGQKIAYSTAALTALVLGLGPKNIGHAAVGAGRGARNRWNWWKAPRANRAWAAHTERQTRKYANSHMSTPKGPIVNGTYRDARAMTVYRGKAIDKLTRKPIIQIAMEMKNKMAAEKAGKKPAVVPPLRASFQLPVKRHKPVPAAPPPGPSTVMHVHNHFGPRPSRPMKKLAAGSAKKEISASPFVFKEGEDYRWVLLSSNGYRDRDGEIISTKALERDVALWELEGRPTQPLRWWHVSLTPDYSRGVEVGTTDFRMVHGRTLIESGKFIDPVVGEAVFKAQDGLAASVGFRHSPNEPNSDKIFNTVHIFERSLLPKGRQSNVLTQLVVH